MKLEYNPQTEEEAYSLLLNPFVFIFVMWGLEPQEVLPEYKDLLLECRGSGNYSKMKLSMFEKYEKGKHITWQQVEVIHAVYYAMRGIKKRNISIRSGRGI